LSVGLRRSRNCPDGEAHRDQTAESSAGAGTQPVPIFNRDGGENNEFEVLTKASKGYALILPNPIFDIQWSIFNVQ
ncbi:MAG: hypothetical protein ABIN36_15910, partial [Ferruginibacter sp.]